MNQETHAPVCDVALIGEDRGTEEVLRSLQAIEGLVAGQVGRVSLISSTMSKEDRKSLGAAAPSVAVVADHRGAIGTAGYLLVLRCGDIVRARTLEKIATDLKKGIARPLYALAPVGVYRLNRRLRNKTVISLERDSTVMWTGSAGYAVGTTLAAAVPGDVTGAVGSVDLFLNLAAEIGGYTPIPQAVECVGALEDALTVGSVLYNPDWYHELNRSFRRLFLRLLARHGGVPQYLQFAYLYELQWRLKYNRNSADKMVLRGAELDRFFADVGENLSYLSNRVIVTAPDGLQLDLATRLFLLRLKGAADALSYRFYRDEVSLLADNQPIASASTTSLDIEAMEVERGTLRASGRYIFPISAEGIRIVATSADGVETQFTRTDRRSDTRHFGRVTHTAWTFSLSLPLTKRRSDAIRFLLEVPGHESRVPLDIRFRRAPSKLTNDKKTYWVCGPYVFTYRERRIVITRASRRRLVRMERQYLQALVRSGSKEARSAALLRVLFFLTRRYFKRQPIWIYFDKLYKAGDNGEYAYRYAADQRDGIGKYYVLQDDVPDARRFHREHVRYVKFGSLLHKLLFLNAEIVFTTHINPQNFGGFSGGLDRYVRGLLRYRLVCIQHGLSVQDLSGTLNQVYDNTTMFCLAARTEADNLFRPEYGYSPEQVVFTGLARYDGLVSRPRRRILIAPTWRNYLATPYAMGRSRGYSTVFKNSEYCRLYNLIITDQVLLDVAREHGFQIVFLLHPVTSSQVDDFVASDVVDVVASAQGVNYEEMLTQADLLVTDYSGIQFDFAYMYKPVVYFHPPQLPPAYEEGAYRYDSMALGPITETIDDLISVLTAAIRTGCRLDEQYRRRIDDFFVFHDRDNARRIYEVGRRLQER